MPYLPCHDRNNATERHAVPFPLLDGYRVLDLSQYVPGPYATLLLADLGAEVVRVEPPGGDPMRAFGPIDADGVSAWYKVVNRGKTVVELDLKSEAGKDSFAALVAKADAMLQSYRPGVLERLGFSNERLSALNPRLVHGSLSGWGWTGPYRLRAGHDLNYMALMGGLVTSGPAEAPSISFPQVADYASGVQSALGIVAGLLGRDRPGGSGKGCFVDTSIAEAVMPWQVWTMTGMLRPGHAVARQGMYLNGGNACYNVYRTKDGRFVTLGAVETKFWANFCQAVGRPEWTERQWEEAPQTALIDEVAALVATKSLAEWEALLDDVDCCFERIHEMAEVAEHPHIKARNLVRRHGGADPFFEILFPAWIDGKPADDRAPIKMASAEDVIEGWAAAR